MTTSAFKSGKRAARDRLKAIEQARSARAKATARRHADVSRDELAWPCARDRRCPITFTGALAQLRALAADCAIGQSVSPTLDAICRRLGS
jgi:hypothetical protein